MLDKGEVDGRDDSWIPDTLMGWMMELASEKEAWKGPLFGEEDEISFGYQGDHWVYGWELKLRAELKWTVGSSLVHNWQGKLWAGKNFPLADGESIIQGRKDQEVRMHSGHLEET